MRFPSNKQYKIIYSDPAWSYKDKALAGKRGASSKYPTMKKRVITEKIQSPPLFDQSL